MKALRIAAGIGAVAGVLAIAGCPLIGLPGPTTTPFPGFDSAKAKLTGRFTFGNAAPPQALKAYYKPSGGTKTQVEAQADPGGYFFFENVTPGKYQIIFDDLGEEILKADVNTANIYVSDPVTSPPTDFKVPQITMELKWEPKMKPEPSGTFDGTFTFATYPNLPGEAEYEVSIFNSTKNAIASVKTTSGTATWDKKMTSGSTAAAGDYYYQIKFYKKSGIFGGENFYGMMKYIKFKIS